MLPPTYLPVSVPVCSALSPVTMDKLSMLLSKVIPSSSPYTLLPTPGNDHFLPHAICVFLSTSSSSPAVIPTCCLILKKKKISWQHSVSPSSQPGYFLPSSDLPSGLYWLLPPNPLSLFSVENLWSRCCSHNIGTRDPWIVKSNGQLSIFLLLPPWATFDTDE